MGHKKIGDWIFPQGTVDIDRLGKLGMKEVILTMSQKAHPSPKRPDPAFRRMELASSISDLYTASSLFMMAKVAVKTFGPKNIKAM